VAICGKYTATEPQVHFCDTAKYIDTGPQRVKDACERSLSYYVHENYFYMHGSRHGLPQETSL